ncbi:MAG: hypothetical protein HXY25_07520 [Alphaproteobacteria bacterium]|nr:hypothetical protein [Alphaproteobacteria bacterium]
MSPQLLGLLIAAGLGLALLAVIAWRRRPSVAPLSEVVAQYRRMARRAPGRFAPALALSLQELSRELMAAGRTEAALIAVQEAVDILRLLARADAARYAKPLSEALSLEERLATALGIGHTIAGRPLGQVSFVLEATRSLGDRLALMAWAIAFAMLVLSVLALGYVAFMSGYQVL